MRRVEAERFTAPANSSDCAVLSGYSAIWPCDEFQTALTAAVDKRDRVGQFLAHLEQQIDFAKFEIDRLRQRKATCERALARLEDYVIGTIENLGTDGKGKYRRSLY